MKLGFGRTDVAVIFILPRSSLDRPIKINGSGRADQIQPKRASQIPTQAQAVGRFRMLGRR